MKVKYIILYLLAGLSITSCSNNEEIAADSDTLLKVSAGVISNPAQSRSTYDGSTTKWETTDCIGVTGSGSTNMSYKANTADATAAFTATGSGITAMPAQTYTAYYPFGGTEGTENNRAVNIGADNTIDYMYATATPVDEKASFTFSHQLAKLTVKVTSDGTSEVSGAIWEINGIHTGSIVPSTGVVTTASGTANSADKGTGTYLLLPAQTLAGAIFVSANSIPYMVDLSSQNVTLQAGKNTTLTLKLTGASLTVQGNTISDWNAVSADDSYVYQGGTYSGHEWVQLE